VHSLCQRRYKLTRILVYSTQFFFWRAPNKILQNVPLSFYMSIPFVCPSLTPQNNSFCKKEIGD